MPNLSSYTGATTLISGITAQGGKDIPLVEAHAVLCDNDGTRLDSILFNLNSKGIVKETFTDSFTSLDVFTFNVSDLLSVRANVRFKVTDGTKTGWVRYPFRIDHPYTGEVDSRIIFEPVRIIFEEDDSGNTYARDLIKTFIVYEKYDNSVSDTTRRICFKVVTNGSSVTCSDLTLLLDVSEGLVSTNLTSIDEDETMGQWTKCDSLNIHSADWYNKTSVTNISSRASAEYAFVTGKSNTAESTYSGSGGYNNKNNGNFTLIYGHSNQVGKNGGGAGNSEGCAIFGYSNKCDSDYGLISGKQNTIPTNLTCNTLLGNNLTATADRQLIIGQYNDTTDTSSVFVVANGSSTAPRNVFKVTPSGSVTSSSSITALTGNIQASAGMVKALGYNGYVVATRDVECGEVNINKQSYTDSEGKSATTSGRLTVAGTSSFTGTATFSGNVIISSGYLRTRKMDLPNASGSTTYTYGQSGQVLYSGGSSGTVYWGDPAGGATLDDIDNAIMNATY